VNDELERMWKEAVVASFKVLCRICLEGLIKTAKNLSQDSRPPAELKLGPPEYRVLTTTSSVNPKELVLR
jgi:hypothetical protein